MEKLLAGKTVLITGGTSVLGRVFVRKALAQGARVFATFYRNQEEAAALEKAGAEIFELDLSDTRAIDQFASAVKTRTKQLDILLHNAACVRDHTIQNLTEEEWDTVLAVNLKAPYYLTKKVLSLLFKSESARVLMITSRAAVNGAAGASNYAASKAGIIGLVKSMAAELGKKKILVNAVNPGYMQSAMTESLPDFVVEQHLAASPLNRRSDPAEVADFLVYLSSAAAAGVTGQVLHWESRKI